MTSVVRFFLFFSSVITTITTQAYATDTLRFIGDVNYTTGEKFQDTEIGGLSGITYDHENKNLLAISDDRSAINTARFYEFNLSLTDKAFSLTPSAVIKLKNKEGEDFKKDATDFEGISLRGQNILVSSETAPELYLFKRDGSFKELIPVPGKFATLRNNLSFEALSTSLDSKTTFMGSENALTQDGPVADAKNGSPIRIILYKDLKPFKEIIYLTEKVETDDGDNGLVDIAAIDENNFYALERSYLPSLKKNVIRIFKCTITTKTTNVFKLTSLKGVIYKSVDKALVANLEDFTSKMTLAKLDNIEGMTFGPNLPNGNKSLIVVSDNNFNKAQRTLFMAFEILP